MGIDLIGATKFFIEITSEYFNVTGLVNDLSTGIQLGVVPWNSLHDFGGANKSTLLAMHELRQTPSTLLNTKSSPLLVAPLIHHCSFVVIGCQARGKCGLIHADLLFLVNNCLPWQVGRGIPLPNFGLFVQLAEGRTRQRVIPRKNRIGIVLDNVLDCINISISD